MKIIFSPTKTMGMEAKSCHGISVPCFMENGEELRSDLQRKNEAELKTIWGCSDSLVKENIKRFFSEEKKVPAVFAYNGISYKYLRPGEMTEKELSYLSDNMYILSGLYGVLRPFDGISFYRLDMGCKYRTNDGKDLYAYWGRKIHDEVYKSKETVIGLASGEYSKSVKKYLAEDEKYIEISFLENENGIYKDKGTYSKMARGEMLRFLAENDIQNPEKIKAFAGMNYRFSADLSSEKEFVFIR